MELPDGQLGEAGSLALLKEMLSNLVAEVVGFNELETQAWWRVIWNVVMCCLYFEMRTYIFKF